MEYDFDTMDDFNFKGKTVLLRVDINSPVDPTTGDILDDTRMQLHSRTIDELAEKGAKVVILAHQSRPGKSDFTTLKKHADAISNIIGKDVQYIDTIFSKQAQDTIRNLVNGEILLLENVRFYSEEMPKLSSKEQLNTHMVRNLAPLADYFVNDAFSSSQITNINRRIFTSTTFCCRKSNGRRTNSIIQCIRQCKRTKSICIRWNKSR